MNYKTRGSESVLRKLTINQITPLGTEDMVNEFTPDLSIYPLASAKIMQYVTKKPVIDTEYYKSSEL